MKILSEISPGELLDKISILEIKLDKVKDVENLNKVKKEYDLLTKTRNSSIKEDKKIQDLFLELKKVNMNLWNIEDQLRICEKNKKFDKDFIELARSVYINNDTRAKIKFEINKLLKSNIVEVKQYVKY
tara:strand:+ start:3008 stop:3394 length:387 start_codon:yes stop_codon:yes gene_type:complete